MAPEYNRLYMAGIEYVNDVEIFYRMTDGAVDGMQSAWRLESNLVEEAADVWKVPEEATDAEKVAGEVPDAGKVAGESGRVADDVIEGGSSTVDDVYAGVKQASEYLKQQGVPRKYRKQVLESFDVRTIKLETAGESTYGLRFYGGNASVEGRYLFETFSPQTNRANLALPYEWNSMTGIQQFQVKSGTTIITGAAAPQTEFGAQYIGGAHQWYINNLEDMIKCQ